MTTLFPKSTLRSNALAAPFPLMIETLIDPSYSSAPERAQASTPQVMPLCS